MEPILPLLSPSDTLERRLRRVLEVHQLSVCRVPTWSLLRELAAGADAIVMDGEALDDPGDASDLFRLSALNPTAALVLVVPVRALPRLSSTLPTHCDVLALPIDLPNMGSRVARSRFLGWARRMHRRIQLAEHIPFLARLALREALRVHAPAVGQSECPSRVTSMNQVAHNIGVSRGHLSGVLSRADVRLRQVMDAWVVVQAHMLRRYERLPWERIAWRLGYASLSGLSDAFRRSVGDRLREADQVGPEARLRWFEVEVLDQLVQLPPAN